MVLMEHGVIAQHFVGDYGGGSPLLQNSAFLFPKIVRTLFSLTAAGVNQGLVRNAGA